MKHEYLRALICHLVELQIKIKFLPWSEENIEQLIIVMQAEY